MSVLISVAPVAAFDPHGDPNSVSQRWKKWIRGFKMYADASGCSDKKQRRQLLLHSSGPEVQDIFDTLGDTGADFDSACKALTDYFTPQQNDPYNRHLFRQEQQAEGETVAQFATRLRALSIPCNFGDMADDCIRDQIIDKCMSKTLRTKLLAESKLTLKRLLEIAQAKEASERQAAQFRPADKVYAVHHNRHGQQGHSGRHRSDKRSDDGQSTSDSRKSLKCTRCGRSGHTGAECRCSKNIKCYKCGTMGHFASVCRNEKESSKTHPVRLVADSSDASNSEDEYSWCIPGGMEKITVVVDGVEVQMVVDSGSTCNVVNSHIRSALEARGTIFKRSSKSIRPYGSPALKVSGQATVSISYGSRSIEATVVCIDGDAPPLLGKHSAENLRVLNIDMAAFHVSASSTNTDMIEREFPGITKGIGKYVGGEITLHIDKTVPPVARKHSRVPFHLRKAVEQELAKLESEDVIERVSGPTEWVSMIVVAPKPKSPNEIRMCVDMREPNKAILRTRHVCPTIDDLVTDLNGSKIFSKIDLRSGYHQLVLEENSRYITAFSTHAGLFRYKRLSFGVNSAAEVFQHTIQSVIHNVKGARNVSDDIIVFGASVEDHDKALRGVLQALHTAGLTINAKKCLFHCSEIDFYGYVFSEKGLSPDPLKVQALRDASPPTNATEVRSFLGMVQYSARFIDNLATMSEPLRKLTKKGAEWLWTETEAVAFDKMKGALSEDTTVRYFDPKKETTILVDASPVGVAGILSQEGRPVAYASRSLSDVEQRYSQTEREALAVVWACEHFHIYLSGAPFTKLYIRKST